jgi:membrane protein YdbS with pleckstrin-like domain
VIEDEKPKKNVDLARVAWLVTVLICLVTALIVALQGYLGYAAATFAVAVSAAINLR